MDKILVAGFDSESQAFYGKRLLQELHQEGSLTLFAAAVIAKGGDGKVSVKETPDEGPLGLVVTTVISGLVGLLGGSVGALFGVGALTAPLGAAAGVVGGSFIATMLDFVKVGGRAELVDEIAGYLRPGRAVVVAEIDEDQVLPVNTRLEAAGGNVFRQPCTDADYLLVERDLAALASELAELRAELAQTSEADRVKLQEKIDAAAARLRAKVDLAKRMAEAARRVAEAKVKSLEEQQATARGDWKVDLQRRAVRIRADSEERSGRLRQAWEHAEKEQGA